MTQPPLSRQLKDLEAELGKQLLIRGSKNISLTEDGMLLRKRAEELVELMGKTKAELTSPTESVSGQVYIGSGETDGISFMAQAASNLQRTNPAISYHIYSGDASHVTERLDKGLIDFGLLIEPVDISKYDYIRLPMKDTWGVLMRKDHPLAEKEQILAEDLLYQPLLLSHQLAASSEFSAWFKTDWSRLRITAAYELIYNATHFVKKGLGSSHCSRQTGKYLRKQPLFASGPCIRPWRPDSALSGKNIRFFPEPQACFWNRCQRI